jgi:hypothetical protein
MLPKSRSVHCLLSFVSSAWPGSSVARQCRVHLYGYKTREWSSLLSRLCIQVSFPVWCQRVHVDDIKLLKCAGPRNVPDDLFHRESSAPCISRSSTLRMGHPHRTCFCCSHPLSCYMSGSYVPGAACDESLAVSPPPRAAFTVSFPHSRMSHGKVRGPCWLVAIGSRGRAQARA